MVGSTSEIRPSQVVTIIVYTAGFAHPLSAYCIRVMYACVQTRSKFKFEKADVGTMPTPYSIDLRWRVVWFDLVYGFASHEIADLFCGEKCASSNTHAHTNSPRSCGQWLCKPV